MTTRDCRECGALVFVGQCTDTGIVHVLDRTRSVSGLVFTVDRRGLYALDYATDSSKYTQLFRLHNCKGDALTRNYNVATPHEEFEADPNQKKPADFLNAVLLVEVTERKEVKNKFKAKDDDPDTKPMVVADVTALDGPYAGQTHGKVGFMGVALVKDLPAVGEPPMLGRLIKKAMGAGQGYVIEPPTEAHIALADSYMDAKEKGKVGGAAPVAEAAPPVAEKPPWEK